MSTTVPAPRIHSAITALLTSRHVPEDHATYVADTLVDTSLHGIDTHGVRLIPTYVHELDGGRAKARPNMRIEHRLPAIGVMDADDALGVVAGNVAMRDAIERASRYGIAATSVARSNHFGAAGRYARLAAQHGQIGLVFSNSDALVAPHNGIAALNGTNPLAMAARGVGDDEFLFDMATSQTAYSRIKHHLANGLPLPTGWAIAADGEDASIARSVAALLPLGGHKGQGLGMLVQILTTLLTNMPSDADLSHLYEPPYDAPRQVGHYMIAIDIGAFCDADHFKQRLSDLLTRFRNSPSANGEPVLVPGDIERATRKRRMVEGIPLGRAEVEVLEPFFVGEAGSVSR